MKLQPQNNRILVEAIQLSSSGIILPETSAASVTHFHVHAVAPDVTCCKPGDAVMLRPDPNILGLRSLDPTQMLGLCDASAVFAVLTGVEVPEVEV